MSDIDNSRTPRDRNAFKAFFSNPLVGLIGSIASVIGLFLAVYFYVERKEVPALTYYVNPARAVVMKAGQASRLTATYDGNAIATDITAAQVAIWNEGTRAIRTNDILEPIVIYTENGVPILEATLRKNSRGVTQLAVDNTELQKGRVMVSWNILEHNDGGVIQLIYAGAPNLNIYASGIIEGQSQINQQVSERVKSPDETYASQKTSGRKIGLIFTILGFVMLLFSFFIVVRQLRQGTFKWRSDFIGVVAPPIVIIGGLYFLFWAQTPGPPFGF